MQDHVVESDGSLAHPIKTQATFDIETPFVASGERIFRNDTTGSVENALLIISITTSVDLIKVVLCGMQS